MICPQKPQDKTGTIIAVKHSERKSGQLWLIHTLWKAFLISRATFLNSYSTASFILLNPKERLNLPAWLTECWHDQDLLPDDCLKLNIFFQCPIFLEKSSVKGKRDGRKGWKGRERRSQEFSCTGIVEGHKDRKKKEECKSKIIFSPCYILVSNIIQTPSSKSLHQLLTASSSQSFLQSASHQQHEKVTSGIPPTSALPQVTGKPYLITLNSFQKLDIRELWLSEN